MPTRPGQVPLQFASVRIGPSWRDKGRAGQVGVLPNGFGDNQRGTFGDFREDLHAILLAVDKAVALWDRQRDHA